MAARHALKWARQAHIAVRVEGNELVVNSSRSCFGPGATEAVVDQLFTHKAKVIEKLNAQKAKQAKPVARQGTRQAKRR